MKILKIFSLVVVLHMALVVMLVLQPGCNSVSGGDTVSMASPVGNSDYSDMWVTGDESMPQQQQRSVLRETNEDLTRKGTNAPNSNVAYSEMDVNEDFVDIERAEFKTASVRTENSEHFEYMVQKGDSLWKIAHTNGVSLRKLMDFNELRETDRIHPGQTLLVPGKPKATVALAQLEVPKVNKTIESKSAPKERKNKKKLLAVEKPEASPVTATKETAAEAEKKESSVVLAGSTLSPVSMGLPEATGNGIYEVAPGDSLYLIAMHNNTTVEKIREMNGMEKNLIKPGQKIRIPGKYNGPIELPKKEAEESKSFAVAFNDVPVKNADADYLQHEVQPGEYPGLIARKYNMSLTDLLHLNDIRNPRMLKVGAKLKVINPDAMMKSSTVASTESEAEKSVASNEESKDPAKGEEAVSTINFEDFPVIRVGS